VGGGAVEKKQVYFEYAKVQWESDQVSLLNLLYLLSVDMRSVVCGSVAVWLCCQGSSSAAATACAGWRGS
jgi:hypothetical protein